MCGPVQQTQWAEALNKISDECHNISVDYGFWTDCPDTAWEPQWLLARLALIHSEVSEALEIGRKEPSNENKQHFFEELADVVIRVGDLASALALEESFNPDVTDLGSALVAKMAANKARPYKHGKNA